MPGIGGFNILPTFLVFNGLRYDKQPLSLEKITEILLVGMERYFDSLVSQGCPKFGPFEGVGFDFFVWSSIRLLRDRLAPSKRCMKRTPMLCTLGWWSFELLDQTISAMATRKCPIFGLKTKRTAEATSGGGSAKQIAAPLRLTF
jgi:hypothetical protein